ncbi:MAG TPA: hypothetical protein VL486_01800 [Verrucomicrobiae bacterium]|nr:hypothetical protein [Verrucomicrobiae bacterium]
MSTIHQANRRLAAVATCCALLAAVTSARAEEPKQRLLAEYVPSSMLAEPLLSTNSAEGRAVVNVIDGETAVRSIRAPSPERTDGDRWEQFQTEFGIHKRDSSLVKSSLQVAKYRLDETVFVVNEFVQNVEHKFSFDYELRSLGQPANSSVSSPVAASSPIPLWDAVQEAHFKSDINLDTARGHAFVGVRLVLPLGD